jgi:hypothetical protein
MTSSPAPGPVGRVILSSRIVLATYRRWREDRDSLDTQRDLSQAMEALEVRLGEYDRLRGRRKG